jgi:hypothetical protein
VPIRFAPGILPLNDSGEADSSLFQEMPYLEGESRRENEPGVLAAVANRLGEAGIDLEALCTTGITDDLVEVALVCDNPKKANTLSKEF